VTVGGFYQGAKYVSKGNTTKRYKLPE